MLMHRRAGDLFLKYICNGNAGGGMVEDCGGNSESEIEWRRNAMLSPRVEHGCN